MPCSTCRELLTHPCLFKVDAPLGRRDNAHGTAFGSETRALETYNHEDKARSFLVPGSTSADTSFVFGLDSRDQFVRCELSHHLLVRLLMKNGSAVQS